MQRLLAVFVLLAACGGARGGSIGPFPESDADTDGGADAAPEETGSVCSSVEGTSCPCGAGTGVLRCVNDSPTCVCPGMDASTPDVGPPPMDARPADSLTCGNVQSDPLNCGACGVRCPSGSRGAAACASGRCSLRCDTGYGDCDGSASNGCESSLDSTSSCGGCGVRCAAGERCASGRCTAPPPDVSGGMCPASCRTTDDCNPCRMPGDPGNYCCLSGLCLYMTGACMAPLPDGGTPDAVDPGDVGDAGDGGG